MKVFLLSIILIFAINNSNAQGWGQTQKIVPSNRAQVDRFGWSVSIKGDVAAIAANNKNVLASSGGAVYIYNKDNNGEWLQAQQLNNSDQKQFDFFGMSIDIDGDFMIVGARGQDFDENGGGTFYDAGGAAYIFEKDGSGNWSQIQKLVSSDRGETFQPLFGEAVAISGDYIVVNAPREVKGLTGQNDLNNSGACYIFERDVNGVWNEVQKIVPSQRYVGDRFGDFSLEISGNIIAVGSFRHDFDDKEANEVSSTGAVYVFERDTNGIWNEIQKIVASDRERGEWFGKSVAIEGNLLIVGASQEYLQSNLSAQYGAVYIFERDGSGMYNEVQKIQPDALIHQSKFGHSLDIDGNNLIVGAYLMGIGSISSGGAAFVFEKDGSGTWNQTAVMYDEGVNTGDDFGYNVAISGGFALVGAYEQDEDKDGLNPLSQAGAAYIFDLNEPNTLSSLATLNVSESSFQNIFKAYPNPFNEVLNLGNPYEKVFVKIRNTLGQVVFSETYLNTKSIQLILNQPNGIYLVEIKNSKGETTFLRVVKH